MTALLSNPQGVSAETLEFGGRPERFRGRGDLTPPHCTVQAPSAAGVPFQILWACEDDDSAAPDIRTELWVLEKGAQAWRLVNPFLGFPAGMDVTAGVLRSTTVKEGLPATFRVVALDRAGNTTFSPALTVNPGDSANLSCNLSITTSATETSDSGDTTGVPSQTVEITGMVAEVLLSSSTSFSISAGAQTATICEVDSICQSDGKIQFAGSGTNDSGANFELSVAPGNFSASLTGSVTTGGSSVSAVSLSGVTAFEDVSASVELSCSGTSETDTTTAETTETSDTVDTEFSDELDTEALSSGEETL